MIVHQFGPIYGTAIIAIVQCMCASYVFWGGESGGLMDDFSGVGWVPPT